MMTSWHVTAYMPGCLPDDPDMPIVCGTEIEAIEQATEWIGCAFDLPPEEIDECIRELIHYGRSPLSDGYRIEIAKVVNDAP